VTYEDVVVRDLINFFLVMMLLPILIFQRKPQMRM